MCLLVRTFSSFCNDFFSYLEWVRSPGDGAQHSQLRRLHDATGAAEQVYLNIGVVFRNPCKIAISSYANLRKRLQVGEMDSWNGKKVTCWGPYQPEAVAETTMIQGEQRCDVTYCLVLIWTLNPELTFLSEQNDIIIKLNIKLRHGWTDKPWLNNYCDGRAFKASRSPF